MAKTPAATPTAAESAPFARGATAPAPLPPVLVDYPDTGEGLQVVTLIGLLAEPTQYRVGKPIPQDLTVDGAIYNLSDREAGTYNFRHP